MSRAGEPERKVHRTPDGKPGCLEQRRGVEEPPQTHPNRALGAAPTTKEGANLQGFTPARAHLLLQGVYGDSPHQNDRIHLTGEVPKNSIWKSCW